MSLDLISSHFFAFFATAILPLLVSCLHSVLKGKSQWFFSFCLIESSSSSFSYRVKSKWLATLSFIVTVTSNELQVHLGPRYTTGCKPSKKKKKNRDSRELVPANLFVDDHSRKLVPAKCIFFRPANISTPKVNHSLLFC